MWYHAITEFSESRRYWWNRTRDSLVESLLMPLLSKQVVSVKRRGRNNLFNFGVISYVTILKTDEKIKRPSEGQPPEELKDTGFIREHDATDEFLDEIRLLQAAPSTRSLIQQAIAEPLQQIFVVMKFGDAFLDSAYEGVIKPIGEEFGYKVLRVDEIQNSGHITSQILEGIASSKIVLVELSGERPNCYYEAGYAHALGRKVIFCIRTGETVHFDLAGYRFIQWETEAALRSKLRERLNAYAEQEED
jgi:hypothetical protein